MGGLAKMRNGLKVAQSLSLIRGKQKYDWLFDHEDPNSSRIEDKEGPFDSAI